ncbi:MAG: glycosyltransferase family 4 protein [bacterium]|nr:glycosyltransferase family 4 protein [bacterium]MCP4798658.1 glycosyltransferase family 4 protein [bacterium]
MTDKRKHILLDATVVNSKPTGVGRSILEIISNLSQIETPFRFTVAVSDLAFFDFLEDKTNWNVVQVKHCGSGFLHRLFTTHLEIPKLAKKLDVDLVHFMTIPASLHLSCQSILTVHDIAFHLFPNTVDLMRRIYYRATLGLSIRNASAIITNSKTTATELSELHPEAKDIIEVTTFGLPQWAETDFPESMRNNSAPLLFVGSLEPRKNLDRILDAYLQFRKSNQDSELPVLTIAGGRGWLDNKLVKRIEILESEKLVTWFGYCTPDKLMELYKSSSALLFPSLHEGFGFPILEAMASNLPVITSNRGAMKEVAGGAALLVDPESTDSIAQAIEQLYINRALSEKITKLGAIRCKELNWLKTANETLDIYKRILILR